MKISYSSTAGRCRSNATVSTKQYDSKAITMKVPKNVWKVLVQFRVWFHRVGGKGPGEGLGGFRRSFRRSSEMCKRLALQRDSANQKRVEK